MYEKFFGISGRPFDLTPNPEFLFLGKKHSLALALLRYSIESQAAIAVITGEIGSGKTTLLYHLLARAPSDATISLISQTPSSLDDLISWVLADRGIDMEATEPAVRRRQLLNIARDLSERGQRLIVLIDEAQSLDVATLEGVRMLTNVNHGGHVALQLVLVGQPDLLINLRRRDLKQLAQRVAMDFHLQALESGETAEYIAHRLAVVGGDRAIFPSGTCALVHDASGGVPRLINSLCDLGLVYAFADGKRHVSRELMAAVVRDRCAGGIMPLRGVGSDDGGADSSAEELTRALAG